jgi:hypothetical protein
MPKLPKRLLKNDKKWKFSNLISDRSNYRRAKQMPPLRFLSDSGPDRYSMRAKIIILKF